MSKTDVLFETAGAVATLTLNRPQKLNAITAEMAGEIARIARQVDTSDDIRMLVVSGAGDAVSQEHHPPEPGSQHRARAGVGERRLHADNVELARQGTIVVRERP